MMAGVQIFYILLFISNVLSATASRYHSESTTSMSYNSSYSSLASGEDGARYSEDGARYGEDMYSSKEQVRFNSPDLVLSANHVITNEPRTREYTFVVTNQTGAPDGFLRSMLVINGQYPGPLIEGDTINVLVVNRMNRPVSIHWHGLHQKGTPWMDGVSGVTDCPIQPGVSFLYSFTVQGQFGTFWYHVRRSTRYQEHPAHTRNLKADGIVGPLIVHSPRDPLVRGRDFDEDMIVVVSTSTYILGEQLSTRGYNGSFAAPSPNSAIMNGIGYFDCLRYAPGRQCQTRTQPLELSVKPNSKTRLRFIQSSSHALFRISVDSHRLDIIEADATPVQSQFHMERVQIHGGERYSVILNTANDREGDSFYLRAAIDIDCLAPGLDNAAGNTAKAVIRVTNRRTLTEGSSLRLPRDSDWPPSSIGTCYDVDSTALTPRLRPSLTTNAVGRVFFNVSFGTIVVADQPTASARRVLGRFFVDNTTYIARLQKPLLHHMLQGGAGRLNSSEVASETLPTPGVWDITCLVARGPGALNDLTATKVRYNTETPVCRDVHVLPGNTYNVLRVQANNPGVWFFHCHLGWHLGAGFAGVVVLQPDVVAQMQLPPKSRALCQSQDVADDL
ncbi:hypothetical protein PSTT_10854, partial [Puccinia striiformis]